jgi:hypothetical protein
MINTKKKRYKNKKIRFNNNDIKHTKKFKILGLIYNEKLNFMNHLKNGTKKKQGLITKIKQKISLIRKIKYWMSTCQLINVANAHIQGSLQYGISLWAKENFNIIDKIEELRCSVVQIILGNDRIKDMNVKKN